MRNLLCLLVLIIITAIIFAKFYRPEKGTFEHPVSSLKNPARKYDSEPKNPLPAPGIITGTKKLEEMYYRAIYELAGAIDKEGLNAEELNQRALSMEKEDFLSSLPRRLKHLYENLYKAVEKLQDAQLKADGRDRSFFKRYKPDYPDWIKKREKELSLIELPPVVKDFVKEKETSYEISDFDLRRIVDACEENPMCIEKSIYNLIRTNHLLTESQFDFLEYYL